MGDALRSIASRPRRAAIAVFVLALIVRLVFVASIGWSLSPAELKDDSPDYFNIATNLANGDGYTDVWPGIGPDHGKLTFTAYRTPLWPVVQAIAYKVAHPSPTLGRLLCVLLDAVGCALIVLLGARIRGPSVGLVAGAAAALYPTMWVHVVQLFSEPLMTVVVVGTLLVADRYRRAPSWGNAAWLGVGLGLVTLARPNGIVLALFLAGWLVWRARYELRRALGAAACCLIATAAVVMPWVAYASAQNHAFVPITTQGGALLDGDFNDGTATISSPDWGWWDYQRIIVPLFSSSSQQEWNKQLQTRAIDWIKDHPAGTVKVIALRTVRYFDLYWSQDNRLEERIPTDNRRLNELVVLSWWLAAGLAIAGLVRLARHHELGPWVPALLTFAAMAVSGMTLGGATRYREPAEPVVLLLAATFVVDVLRGWSAPRRATAEPHERRAHEAAGE